MLRNILQYPDARLRTIARPVASFDAELEQLVSDMLETMYHYDGVGLAATQVDVHRQVVVIDVTDNRDQPLVFINPQIEVRDSSLTERRQEGCLSVPEVYDYVERPTDILVRYQDVKGETHSLTPDGLLAVCIQHECDHLRGRLFIDRLSQLKRERITSRLGKASSRRKARA